MKKNYDVLLEKYLIPAEESLFNFTKKIISNKNFTKNTLDSKFVEHKNQEKKISYYESTQNAIIQLRKYHSEEIAKEIRLRTTELFKIANIIDHIKKEYNKIPGFIISSDNIRDYIRDSMGNKDYYEYNFLQDILPITKPVFYTIKNKDKVGYQDWYIDSGYSINVATSDIHKWGEAIYKDEYRNNKISIRDYENTKEYHQTIDRIIDAIENKCQGLTYFMTAEYTGDWDSGSIVIVLKPSEAFLKLAKKYGYIIQ